MGPLRKAGQVLASATFFIVTVNTIVAGGLVGLLVGPWGTSEAVGTGVLAALAYFGAFVLAGMRQFRVNLDPRFTRFPTVPDERSEPYDPAQPDVPAEDR